MKDLSIWQTSRHLQNKALVAQPYHSFIAFTLQTCQNFALFRVKKKTILKKPFANLAYMHNPNITTNRVILFAQRTAMKLPSKNKWQSLDKTFYQVIIILASEFAWSTYYALVAKLSYVFGMNPRQHSTKRCRWCIHYLFSDGYRPKQNKNQQKPVSEKLLGSLLRAHAWLRLKAA